MQSVVGISCRGARDGVLEWPQGSVIGRAGFVLWGNFRRLSIQLKMQVRSS